MFRYRKLFLSRWSAILWSIGICFTAIEVAGFGSGNEQGNAVANGQAAANSSDADLSKLEAQVHAFEGAR